jgi:hypothetical protein
MHSICTVALALLPTDCDQAPHYKLLIFLKKKKKIQWAVCGHGAPSGVAGWGGFADGFPRQQLASLQ